MYAHSRRATGAIARLLVVLFALGTSVPFVAHADAGDDPCDTAVPSGAVTTVRHPGAPVKPQHCEVCHWLRSLSALDVVVDAPADLPERGALAVTIAESPASRLVLRRAPSRAPPA